MTQRKCEECGHVFYDVETAHVICPNCGLNLENQYSSEDASSDLAEPELNKDCLYNAFNYSLKHCTCRNLNRGYVHLECDPDSTVKPTGCPKA